jgi:hypothetical protein
VLSFRFTVFLTALEAKSAQYRQNHAAPKMSAGTGAGDGKVDHLGGEDKRTHYPHQGNSGIIQIIPSLTFLEQYPISPAEAAHLVAPTAGGIKASAMCICQLELSFIIIAK